jgi:hypothetical protein
MTLAGHSINKIFIPKGTYVSRGTIEGGGLGLLYRGWSSLIADHLEQPTFIPLFNPIKPIPPWMEKVKNGSPKTGRPLPFQEIYISTQRKPKWAANHKISISWQNGLNRNHQPIIGLLNVEYYSQRASEGGFRLTEATPISRHVWEPFCSLAV